MEYLPIFAAAFLGAILGSFLNALLFRYNTGRSVLRGRSSCMQCGHTLSAIDLVPILSYLFLRGKCRYCHSKVSWQYPLVELLGTVLAVGIYLELGISLYSALALCSWFVLLFLAVYDLRHQILPWSALFLLSGLALVQIYLVEPSMVAFVAGPATALPFFLLALISRGTWMGWGDAPLGLGVGWLLGLTAGLTAVVLAFWIGASVGIVLLLLSKRYTIKSEVPFAPFLVAGAACAYFLNVDFFQNISALFL